MKKTIQLILIGLLAQSDLQSQNALDASGGFIKNTAYSASYAIGEVQTITLKSGTPAQFATSGVIQPDPVVITLTEDPLKRSFKLYPNPVADVLKIEYEESSNISFKIYNLQGWVLSAGIVEHHELNLATFAPGVYMIELNGKSTGPPQLYLITKN